MLFINMKVNIAIPSHRRHNTIGDETLQFLPYLPDDWTVTVFVHDEKDEKLYKDMICEKVVNTKAPLGIQHMRNAILDHYPKGEKILMLDDDVQALHLKSGQKLYEVNGNKFIQFVETAFKKLEENNMKLFGVYPVPNAYFMNDKIKLDGFCIGTFLGVISSELRFDENLPMKEDYDFTLQHIKAHNGIMRYNQMTIEAKHYKNTGGIFLQRNKQREIAAVEYLMQKWQGWVKRNPKKKGEILINRIFK